VRFTSVFPAATAGAGGTVHVEGYPDLASTADSAAAIATSQVALPQNAFEAVCAEPGYEDSVRAFSRVSLSSDGGFGEDSGPLQLGMVSGDVASGFTVTLAIGVDTQPAPTSGRARR